MYEADQGALRRKYAMPTGKATSPGCEFYSDWSTAVDKIDVSSLSMPGCDDLAKLRKRVAEDRKELEDAYRKTAEVSPLLPFAPKIVALELARRKAGAVATGQSRRRSGQLREEIDQADRPPPTRRTTTCPTCT